MMEVALLDNNTIYGSKMKGLGTYDPDSLFQHSRSQLKNSTGIEASQFVELDLYDDDNEEDEGEIMLLAMILLQLNGVKIPSPSDLLDAENANKKKRQRTSPEQLAILEQIFQTDKMPSQQTRVQLADQLGMSSRRVQIWFQNKRAKVKRGVGKPGEDSQLAPESPLLDISSSEPILIRRNSFTSLSADSSSSLVPDNSFSPTTLSPLSTSCPDIPPPAVLHRPSPPNSPALVPSSPSLPPTTPTKSSPMPIKAKSLLSQHFQFNLDSPTLPSDYNSVLSKNQGV